MSANYDFDRVIDRRNTDSIKFDFATEFGLPADALRGRIGRDQLGMLVLERLETLHEHVEIIVRDHRRVVNIVELAVVIDLFAELFDRTGLIAGQYIGNNVGNARFLRNGDCCVLIISCEHHNVKT